ncbi:MAG: MerR family redox-sensitive transcriptional activator SoxR, partial [Francisellaceae bacterium]
MNKTMLSVGKLADRCGVKISTIHYYEEKGLIFSQRNT